MRKILTIISVLCVGIGVADAAVRDATSPARAATGSASSRTNRGQQSTAGVTNSVQKTTNQRSNGNTITRTATTARNATTTYPARAATTARVAAPQRTATTASSAANTARAATTGRKTVTMPARAATAARAATNIIATAANSNTFGTGYNACRDAYFTCMDQFCATQNDSYRRCVCSSRLSDIQSRERQLGQTASQLQDFVDLNIDVIPKTSAEVKAMLTGTDGENAAASSRDTSSAAKQLSGISEVLAGTKNKSLSTAGTLDIAGDINAIWATTDLTSGANIANLTGDALYNAVHAQCSELVRDTCANSATLNMVVSAYGMYIENDCTTLITALNKKKNAADSAIRETEREMNLARLDNYNAHNSTAINDCIAQVRTDITADTACGKDFVHCLDISGKYLSRDKGEPIYTADFYQLETQISLSGDILTNPSNRMIVSELNRKRQYAERGLETCRDLANDVWDEFMRQAIKEIYQGQQKRIRDVKNECLDVVNKCYDEQSASLKDFSNIKEQLLLGSRLELSEQMCREKLDACSNLYGGGTDGLNELLIAMRNITDQKIAKECRVTLQDYARDMCAVPSNDSLHAYPYGCRVYAPGDQIYASITACNQLLWSNTSGTGGQLPVSPVPPQPTGQGYVCYTYKKYTSCEVGYYMTDANGVADPNPKAGNRCLACPENYTCPGGTTSPIETDTGDDNNAVDCGTNYIGSLYQKMVRYALQTCVRPSQSTGTLPATVLQDVNVVMDEIRIDMAKSLAAECERLGGVWVDTPWRDTVVNTTTRSDGADNIHDVTGHKLHQRFYDETGANTHWGYCANEETISTVSQ